MGAEITASKSSEMNVAWRSHPAKPSGAVNVLMGEPPERVEGQAEVNIPDPDGKEEDGR